MKATGRILTITLLLISSAFISKAQSNTATPVSAATLTFSDYAPLPQRIIYSSYAADGQYLYSLNGLLFNKRVSPAALRYNPVNNQWQQITDRLMPKLNAASIYVPSVHKIYIMGGTKAYSTGLFYQIETVDTQTGQVAILKTENPNPQINCAMAVWNNKIYLFGGSASGYASSRLYEFDVATEKFKRLKDMPYNAQTSGTVVNGILYTFGGHNPYNNFMFNDIYAYDIAANSWKHAGKLPSQVSATSIAQLGKYIYVTGSYGDPDFFGCFNTENNKFTKLKTNMEGRRFASSGVIGSKLFVYGGSSTIIDPGVIKVQGADLTPMLSAQE